MPLYFRPDNPTVRPLTSHNAASHNVIIKVTVPSRTGRKRKRGTDAPFEYHDAPPAKKNAVQEDTPQENAAQEDQVPQEPGVAHLTNEDSEEQNHDAPPDRGAMQDTPANEDGQEHPAQTTTQQNPTNRRPPPTIPPGATSIRSHSHLDTPALLRRKLRDTVGR